MELLNYIPILIQLILAFGMGISILIMSHLLGQRAVKNKIKDSPYECGLLAVGSPHPQFAIKFYVTAMLFIIFDIEVVFLVPWALIYREFLLANIPILVPMLFFMVVLVIGLIYELKKGALKWES